MLHRITKKRTLACERPEFSNESAGERKGGEHFLQIVSPRGTGF